jgi:hypothetical protein
LRRFVRASLRNGTQTAAAAKVPFRPPQRNDRMPTTTFSNASTADCNTAVAPIDLTVRQRPILGRCAKATTGMSIRTGEVS